MTMNVSSSTDSVLADALSGAPELSLGEALAEGELGDAPAVPELPANSPLEFMELEPEESPESPEPEPEFEDDPELF